MNISVEWEIFLSIFGVQFVIIGWILKWIYSHTKEQEQLIRERDRRLMKEEEEIQMINQQIFGDLRDPKKGILGQLERLEKTNERNRRMLERICYQLKIKVDE